MASRSEKSSDRRFLYSFQTLLSKIKLTLTFCTYGLNSWSVKLLTIDHQNFSVLLRSTKGNAYQSGRMSPMPSDFGLVLDDKHLDIMLPLVAW